MSLWTPYADAPLDLSRVVKDETPSPSPPTSTPGVGFVPYVPAQYYGQYYVPGAQLSPASSGYEPHLPSPPVSPASPASARSYILDADAMSDDPDFQAFERDALRAMAERNGGSLLGANPRMRRAVRSSHDAADDSYRRQRERNNMAAKQSRDRRKLREIHLALKVAYLKSELATLRRRLAAPCACRPLQQSHPAPPY